MSGDTPLNLAHQQAFNEAPSVQVSAPGRVNLIGEHTDYNQGFVFPAAINFGTKIVASERSDNEVHVVALDYQGQRNSFSLNDIQFDPKMAWANYIRGVIKVLLAEYPNLPGANLTVSGNVPQGAGLSSSASFEIAILKALQVLFGLSLTGLQAALLGQKAENEFVGCACGIMDQLISALGQKGCAMLLDCRDYHIQQTQIPKDLSIVIINSHVQRGLVDSEYNLRRQQCEQAANIMQVKSLRDADLAMLDSHKSRIPETVYRRARHVITENARTLMMRDALEAGDMAQVSHLMQASHVSMRDDFEITVPNIDFLVEQVAQQVGQQGGVRMTGGGFGGCVVALIPSTLVLQVKHEIEQQYQAHSGIHPDIYVCSAEQGAFS